MTVLRLFTSSSKVKTMEEGLPSARKDLEFTPFQHEGRQLVLIRDHLGLVKEGYALEMPLYQVMAMLDGRVSLRDLQMELMRQKGGVLVDSREIQAVIEHLDESYLLDSERFREARDRIVRQFVSLKVRPCSHCGTAYPDGPVSLGNLLDEILNSKSPESVPEGTVVALISPHIDLAVGASVYSMAYQATRGVSPSRVVVLGVGHHLSGDLFSLTKKDFETPLGLVRTDRVSVERLMEAGRGVISGDDFPHRSEHSIEFQLIFLQHVLGNKDFALVPILCGFARSSLPEYGRAPYLEKAGGFLRALGEILSDQGEETLVVAGVDFSHIGPKFGHDRPAEHLRSQAEAHDRTLLESLSARDPDGFWDESGRVEDGFNVCGFSALACLLEVLPPAKGHLLGYETWCEGPTRSAVSFAAMAFTRGQDGKTVGG
ncbi:MAG: AmmeMemoRadiSam system protein B [Deltaproteobacteria bacterium]|nr:AmmeMemoRadiSam system protein B [Deltaproteobacteria bacterium]